MSSCGAAVGSDGTVYFTGDISLYAINPNGTLKWRSAILGDAPSESRPVIGSDGTIYVGCTDDHLYAIKPDGTLKWKFLTGKDVRSSPAIGSDGTIYVGSKDKKLYAINSNGTLKWTYETGGYIYVTASPAIGSDGTIYIGSKDKKLHAVNPDGTPKWSYETGDCVYSTPAIGADGTIYVGSYDNKLYAINPDGTFKWSYETGDKIRKSSAAVDDDGTIYIGSQDKKFYAINPDGTLKWSYETGDVFASTPAIGSDGTIYIGSYDGKLYAFGPGQAPCGCVGATQTFTCGETVTESCVFNCDMSCPTGHGLVVGGDDIVIDGAGYTIDGVSPGECVLDRAGIYGITLDIRDNVTIKNLKVKNFCSGIFLSGLLDGTKVTNVTIDNCTIYDNGVNATEKKTHGIKMIRVHDSTIENCKIYNNTGGTGCTPPCENGGSGIFLKIGNDNVITNNEIYDNKKGGFFCKASPKRCELSHNEVWGNHQGGLILRCKCTQNFTIEYNNVSYNYGTGIFIGGPCNTIRHNNVSNNMNGAIEGLPDTGTNGCGVNFGRDDVGNCGYPPCGSMGSRLNTLINNTICDNEYLDIWERAAVRGTNNGVENKCDEPDGWNDDGTSGCTYSCTAAPEPNATVYLEPENSSASYCNEVEVEIWANTSDGFQGGQFNLTYDASCANVTDVEFNTAVWDNNTWYSAEDGSEWITFRRDLPVVNGTQLIANMTIHCCNESELCETELHFMSDAEATGHSRYSALFNDSGVELATEWADGTFECVAAPEKPDLNVTDKYETLDDGNFMVTYTVANIGAGDASTSTTNITTSDGQTAADSVPALAAGENYTNTVGPFECACDTTIAVTVYADSENAVDESDEMNNCMVNELVCPPCEPAGYTIRIDEHTINLFGGGEVTVPVEIWNATDVEGGEANVTFDASVVRVIAVSAGNFGTPEANIDNTNGFVHIAASSATAAGEDEAVLAYVVFEGLAEGETDLVIDDAYVSFDAGNTSIPAATDDGHITVETWMRGDLNHNDRLDTGDATLVLRMVVGLTPVDMLGDMNDNGRIDTGDATIILRIIVGLSV